MQKWTLKEIIENARKNSPYYRELYKDITSDQLANLPVVDQTAFWKSEVVTEKNPDGIVYKSGGSTGAPKYSYFTHREWIAYTSSFGWGMSEGILSAGDKVANLFYAGDLYASFLFIKDSLQFITVEKMKITQFPIAGQTDHIQILKTIEEFDINTVVGVPSAILSLLEKYNNKKFPKIKIEKFLFGGEALYDDQFKAIRATFPEIQISSIGCASVDGGMIGYSSKDCANNEHRVNDLVSVIEIIDADTLELITKKNKVGKVLLTNLTRKLMPIVRYPVGDLAMWLEDEGASNRKFKLMGRSDEAARLGTLSVYFEDTREMILKALPEFSGLQFQMVLTHFAHKDELVFKISGLGLEKNKGLEQRILEVFSKEKSSYEDLLKKNLIHALKIEIVEVKELESNHRTGKLKRIIDMRVKE